MRESALFFIEGGVYFVSLFGVLAAAIYAVTLLT